MNKRQLDLQEHLYSLFEEKRNPVFISNLLEKIDLGVIYADLTENEVNEVFTEFREMHDLNENFFKDIKEKHELNHERVTKGIYVSEVQTADGSTKYRKVEKKDAEYILKGRKLYTVDGEFIKNISPVVYKEEFPELSERESELRIRDKNVDLAEEVELVEGFNKRSENFIALKNKKNSGVPLSSEEKEKKDKLNLQIASHNIRTIKHATEADKGKNGVVDPANVQKRLHKEALENKISRLKRQNWSLKDQPDEETTEEIYKTEEKLRNLKESSTLTEAVTYIDNAGRVKTSSTEEYVKSMHEYDTNYQIPVISSVHTKLKKKRGE